MAKLFGIVGNGGIHNGKRLLSHRAIERFTQPLVAGIDASFGIDAAWSVGTHLITMVTGDQHVSSESAKMLISHKDIRRVACCCKDCQKVHFCDIFYYFISL